MHQVESHHRPRKLVVLLAVLLYVYICIYMTRPAAVVLLSPTPPSPTLGQRHDQASAALRLRYLNSTLSEDIWHKRGGVRPPRMETSDIRQPNGWST